MITAERPARWRDRDFKAELLEELRRIRAEETAAQQ